VIVFSNLPISKSPHQLTIRDGCCGESWEACEIIPYRDEAFYLLGRKVLKAQVKPI